MTTQWDPKALSRVLLARYAPEMAKISANKAPKATIDALITFDAHGISSHPNHRALYSASKVFLQSMMRRHSGWEAPTKLYALTTTNILRKYMGVFDAVASVLDVMFSRKEEGEHPTPLFFMSTPHGWATGMNAMTSGHKSQMVWFRWGYVVASRYMVINYLKREKV
jgi:N-acetylglucosaminylphosphatidylinositol deacetylase